MRTITGTRAAFVAAGLYTGALLLPAFREPVRGSTTVHPGYDAFLIGWEAAFRLDQPGWNTTRIVLCVAWAANPCIWTAALCVAAGYRRLGAVYAGLALVAQLSAAWHFWELVGILSGFWLWLLCPVWLLIVARLTARTSHAADLASGRNG